EKRSNATHESTTDKDARLYRKGSGQASQLCFMGHILTENRNGICVDAEMTKANGKAEREAALTMVRRSTDPKRHRVTLGGDKGFDAGDFIVSLVEEGVHPHIAQKEGNYPLIDKRTTGRLGYQMSQRRRKLVEQSFGWLKSAAAMGKARLRSLARVTSHFLLALATLNLVRIANLDAKA